MTRTFTVRSESNQLRGIEAATLLLVEDQHGIVWDNHEISRDCFDSSQAYRRAIEDKRAALKAEWPDEHCNFTDVGTTKEG